jgi:CRP-like cAMP-binding protein
MAKDSKLEHLAQVRLFSACNKKELALIGRRSDEIRRKAGDILVREGTAGHEFFLIMDGTADVRRNGRRVALLGPGQYFGELALLDQAPRNATVTADTDMTLLVLGQREFSGVLDEVPGLAHRMLRAMASRLREADAKSTTN